MFSLRDIKQEASDV